MAGLEVAAVSLDCADPDELAAFYRTLLGASELWRSESSVGLRAGGYTLALQRVDDHRPPDWPGSSILHLDLASGGADLGDLRRHALACGATDAPLQPDRRWLVLLDPAGHPFCITPFTPDGLSTDQVESPER